MKMKKIKLLTDSTSDIPKQLLEKMDIDVFPLNISIDNKEYKDGIDINSHKLFELVESLNNKAHPKTSATSAFLIEEYIKKYLEQGYDEVLYMGIGKCLSATFQNFNIASVNYSNKAFSFDTGNLSSGIVFSLIKAYRMINDGLSSKEIIQRLEKEKNNYIVTFVVKNLDYLHRGGRVKGFAKIFGSALKVRPILRIDHDELYLYKKPAGKFQKALNILIEELITYHNNGLIDYSLPLFLTHSMNEKEQLYIKEQLHLNGINFNEIYIEQTGTTISTHCGPGTSGLCYALKNEYKRPE